MRIATGIAMLVVGAILRFAITWPNPVIDLGVVGAILIGAGFVALVLGIFVAVRPRSTVTTVVSNRPVSTRPEALPPTKPYERP
jgi:hypothetical protein